MQQYLDLLHTVLETGSLKENRTGIQTLSLFGAQMRFNLQDGFPLLTTKKLHTSSIIHELLWFIKGDTNIQYLKDHGVRIWNEWADSEGNLGPVYGHQWRFWGKTKENKQPYYDQLAHLMKEIKENPLSRRLILSAWNVADIDKMALPPCHCLCQFYVDRGALSCQLYQRSADIFLGVPFNIASYALLTHLIAKTNDLEVGDFVHTFGDVHMYINHKEQAKEQLKRKPKDTLPTIQISKKESIDSYVFDDIKITNYIADPHIAAQVAI